jgi:AsmA protein
LKKSKHVLLRFLKITGLTLLSILVILFLAPYLFPDAVSKQIKQWTNQSIRGELNFSKARLSFFTHFPSLTLTLYDVSLKGSEPFRQDTLLSAQKLGFGVNLEKLLFSHQVSVNKIFLNTANINVLVNEKGQANYNIYVSDSSASSKSGSPDSTASLHLEKIIINNSHISYSDLSVPMLIQAEHLYYEGTGDLSKSIFDLKSELKIDSLNFTLDHHSYVQRKAFDAQLITHVNTKTLALIFENNMLKVNKLNLAFYGKLDFLKNGYAIDLNVSSKQADLSQLFTIFPPEYLDWLRQTTVKGTVDLHTVLKGNFIASTGEKPDYSLQLGIRDGFIAYKDAPLPISALKAYLDLKLPSLDPEKMHLKVDSFSFHLDKDFMHGQWENSGLSEPDIDTKVDAFIDLRNLKKATGLSSLDMQGKLVLQLTARGKYFKKIVRTSLRDKDTVVASIPSFELLCNLQNGYIKYYKVEQPIQNIFIKMHASCPDHNYQHAFFRIDSLHASALNNYLDGRAIVHASTDFPLDLTLKGMINLDDIRKVYPLDSLSLSGLLRFDLNSSGKYAPDHHLFPKISAVFSLKDGFIQTSYYPHPIEKMNIEASASDDKGNLNSLNLVIKPASFVFERKPFYVRASFKNFDDLNYDLAVNGDLDLGRIYQVFARKDMGISGYIRTRAEFRGKLSDAKNERYDLLKNLGTLEIHDLRFTSELFPKPFEISEGKFRFDQDKMWLDTFRLKYGKSDMQLDGFAENVINYVLAKNETLKANIDLKSKIIDLNEFSVYASPAPVKSKTADTTGVILVPAGLDLIIKADADRILYNDIVLNQFQGGVNIKNGEVELVETGFELINCQVAMNGKYSSLSPTRASFDYKLQARDFDVQKAYKEIKLFHDLASSAEHASGIISIDYSISGKLNEKMYPIYPSLKGNGVLSVKNVKFNNWKLFNTVSSESGKSELKDPDLSKIEVKSSIKNNLITIERTKFKTGGFRIRFEGQTSFDNKINFKMRIGLPPLGIIGIPIHITGNSDNPKINMGKSDSDQLQEKEEE